MTITRGFIGRTRPEALLADRIRPGQHTTSDFPALTVEPTPTTAPDRWSLTSQKDERILGRRSWFAPDHLDGVFHDLVPPFRVGAGAVPSGGRGGGTGPALVPGAMAPEPVVHLRSGDCVT